MDTARNLILIVEDQQINRLIVRRILEAGGYSVIEAQNGKEGLQQLRAHADVAAVLLDLVMPVMNGYEFLANLRGGDFGELPVIVITGQQDPKTEKQALDSGAWDFLTKPFESSIILSRLKNALARSQVALYEQMQYIAEHDALTGMYNRRKMFSVTKANLAQYPDRPFVFLRLDIDRFRLFNSAFGEAQGDALLRLVADLLMQLCGQQADCVCGRMNADVFCLCEPYEPAGLRAQVETLNTRISRFRQDYLLNISCGACIVSGPEPGMETIYMRASMAAQKCKHQYLQHLAFYDESEGAQTQQEIEIISDMQTALSQQQFVLYFQPKFQLSGDIPFGAEALVRWQHPQKGLLLPGAFIPIFEKNGFITKLDYYVWEHACQYLRDWLDAGFDPAPVSVNVSRISLYNPNICRIFTQLMKKYRLPTQLLYLEITESAYMSNPDLMHDTIRSLRRAGFIIMMDDFGSGYSSLKTLKEIEVDMLKFDMSFLPEQENLAKAEIILISTVRMANWLGMTVVVEGVETEKQRDFLEGIGCDYVQGYFYARPMPAAVYTRDYVNPTGCARKSEARDALLLQPAAEDKVLVVDSDPRQRELLCGYLQAQYTAHACATIEQAIAFARHNKDLQLLLIGGTDAGMTAADFLEYCRFNSALAGIPKMMLTNGENPAGQKQAFARGVYDCLAKPFSRQALLVRAEHVLEMKRIFTQVQKSAQPGLCAAQQDTVTGLPDRIAFKKLCGTMLENSPEHLHAMVIMDIDNFRVINDSRGHLTGDRVLKCIADALRRCLRPNDIAGRYGGDEFAVLLCDISGAAAAKAKAAELMKAVQFACSDKLHLAVWQSLGVAAAQRDDIFDSLFARADEALYEAKNTGKGRVCLFGESIISIQNDDKPIILVCTKDPNLCPSIALAYGNTCAFDKIADLDELRQAFQLYSKRIRAICLDMELSCYRQAQALYSALPGYAAQGPALLAVCAEGDMEQLRRAVQLQIADVVTQPVQADAVRRGLSRLMLLQQKNE